MTCHHTPPCPAPDARDAAAAHIISDQLQECGYALLCNGRLLLEHGELLTVPASAPAPQPASETSAA